MKYILPIMMIFTFYSCDKGAKTPEGLLKMYVNDLSSKSITKEYFEKYTTGKLLDSVSVLTEEDFQKYIKLRVKIKKPRIEIANKNCLEDRCTLTYIIK